MASSSTSRRNQYFVPGEGIAREVITADICKYLDNDATVRPGNYQGRDGYFLFAYRNLTNEMVADLRADSERWESEKKEKAKQRAQRGAPPSSRSAAAGRNPHPVSTSYVDSDVHRARHAYGPNVPETPPPSVTGGYPPPVRAPHQDYGRQPPSPYSDSQYPVQAPPANAYPPSSRAQGYPATYEPIAGHGAPRTAPQPYDYPAYPPEPGYGYSAPQVPPQHAARGAYPPPLPPQTAPPAQRYAREVYDDPRADPRADQRPDPRQDPRVDPRYVEPRGYYPDERRRR